VVGAIDAAERRKFNREMKKIKAQAKGLKKGRSAASTSKEDEDTELPPHAGNWRIFQKLRDIYRLFNVINFWEYFFLSYLKFQYKTQI
jgi:hypothetical protein